MAQHGDATVLFEPVHNHVLHLLRRDGLAGAVDRALRHDHNVQAMSHFTFLWNKGDMGRNKEDMGRNKEGIGRNKGDMGRNKGDLGRNKGDIGRNKEDMGRNKGDMGKTKKTSRETRETSRETKKTSRETKKTSREMSSLWNFTRKIPHHGRRMANVDQKSH